MSKIESLELKTAQVGRLRVRILSWSSFFFRDQSSSSPINIIYVSCSKSPNMRCKVLQSHQPQVVTQFRQYVVSEKEFELLRVAHNDVSAMLLSRISPKQLH